MDLPSHEDRQQFADATRGLPEWAQLSVAEIEDMDEETFGTAIKYGTPAQAVAAMERRLASFQSHKARILDVLGDPATPQDQLPLLESDLHVLQLKLDAAVKRLADYRLQHEHRN